MQNTPLMSFRNAQAFHATFLNAVRGHAQEIAADPNRTLNFLTAGSTSAFACEMYLKTAILASGSSPPREHDLTKLFRKSPPQFQDKLRDLFRQALQRTEGAPSATALDDFLLQNCCAFTKWRYFYESTSPMNIDIKSWVLLLLVLEQVIAQDHGLQAAVSVQSS